LRNCNLYLSFTILVNIIISLKILIILSNITTIS